MKLIVIFFFNKYYERRLPMYFTKVWIMRYQYWLFVQISYFKAGRKPYDYMMMAFSEYSETSSSEAETTMSQFNYFYYILANNSYLSVDKYSSNYKLEKFKF